LILLSLLTFLFLIFFGGRSEANDKIAKVISEFNKQDLAFCLQLGDIIDGNEAPELVIQDLEAVLESISPLKHRLHHILGANCVMT
jgi:hypothetical protein